MMMMICSEVFVCDISDIKTDKTPLYEIVCGYRFKIIVMGILAVFLIFPLPFPEFVRCIASSYS